MLFLLLLLNLFKKINTPQEFCGVNKYYRGLPVTTIALIFPIVYLACGKLPTTIFVCVLHVMLGVVAFFFILDINIKKPDMTKLFHSK